MSPEDSAFEASETHSIQVHLDQLLVQRGMTLTELSERVGMTLANLSILKNGRARAVRFSTLTRLCETLGCQPGDLLSYSANPVPGPPAADPEQSPPSRRRRKS